MRILLACSLLLSACSTPLPGGDDDDRVDDDDTTADDDDATADDDDSALPVDDIDAIVAWAQDPGTIGGDLDALMQEVAWGAGWPLRQGDRWLFLTRWDPGMEGVALVGDVNAWDPAADPATRSASGEHYLAVLDGASFQVAAEGAAYKWFAPPDTWRAGPEATAYGFDSFGRFGYVRPPLDRAWREQFPAFVGAFLEEPRAFRVLLPAGFVASSPGAAAKRVLLGQDGQHLFNPEGPHGGWRVDEALGSAGTEDVVVFGVDNAADRVDAYTQTPDESPLDGVTVGGRAEDMASLLYLEALPWLRARYGLVAQGRSLAVMGSSLGGLLSLYLAMAHPDEQGCVMAMSSTLGWGAFGPTRPGDQALARLWRTSHGHGATAVYLDSGGGVHGSCGDVDGDGIWEDSDDSDNYCTTLQLRDVLEGMGYAFDVDLFHWHEPFASHDEAAWAARVPRALDACAAGGWTAP